MLGIPLAQVIQEATQAAIAAAEASRQRWGDWHGRGIPCYVNIPLRYRNLAALIGSGAHGAASFEEGKRMLGPRGWHWTPKGIPRELPTHMQMAATKAAAQVLTKHGFNVAARQEVMS